MHAPLTVHMASDWAEALAPVEEKVAAMASFLSEETTAGHTVLPAQGQVLRAFSLPLADVRVLIIGQDPYPTPGNAMGLSFSVNADVRPLPGSLRNIYRELESDLGIIPAQHGDLTAWFDQGVLLLNRVLTVRSGLAGAHRGKGWEEITACAVEALANRGGPLVAVLWGKDAQRVTPLLGEVPVIASAHPSPLAARRGFFGSRPFSTVNRILEDQGALPINWRLPAK